MLSTVEICHEKQWLLSSSLKKKKLLIPPANQSKHISVIFLFLDVPGGGKPVGGLFSQMQANVPICQLGCHGQDGAQMPVAMLHCSVTL